MKLHDLIKKEGLTPIENKVISTPEPEASSRKRERPWNQNTEILDSVSDSSLLNSSALKQKISNLEPMEDVLETYGKWADNGRKSPTENGRIIDGKPTENGRIIDGPKTYSIEKPTDKPTDERRKMDGKWTEITSLVGLQRKVFFSLARHSKEFGFSDDNGNRITPPINGNVFAQQTLQKPYKQVKDVIYELKKAKFLSVFKVKNGRGGFVQYLLQKTHYQAFLLNENFNKPTDNGRIMDGKPTDKPTDKPTETLPSSSFLSASASTQPFKSTTTRSDFEDSHEAPASNQLPEDWEEIDYSGLESIKFGKTHLLQLYTRKYCDSKAAQESIWHFAFYLKTPASKTLKHPIAYLMSVMGRDKYFSRPDGYFTPEEEAQQKRINQQRKEIEGRQIRESQFFELVFEEYFLNLSAKKIRELSPVVSNQEATKIIIRNLYFREHWLEIMEAFRQGLSVEQFLLPDALSPTESEKSEPELSAEEIRRIVDEQFGPANN